MVLEMGVIEVSPGAEDAFEAGFREVRHEIADLPACRSIRMTRGVESPSRFVLLVEWDSVEAHQAFRDSPAFGRWRAGIGPHFARPPQVEHYADIG